MTNDNLDPEKVLASIVKEISENMPDFTVVLDLAHDAIQRVDIEGQVAYDRLQREIAIYKQRGDLCIAFWKELITQTWNGKRWEYLKSQMIRSYFSGLAMALDYAGCIELNASSVLHTLEDSELNYVAMQVACYPGVMQRLDPIARDKANHLFKTYQVTFEAISWPPTVKPEALKAKDVDH